MFLTLLQQQAAAGSVTVTPGAGSLTLTGFAPTVTAEQNATLTPGSGALVLSGLAATVSATSNINVAPGTGALVLTGLAATVSTGAVPQEQSNFDTHDGRPRIDWEAPERRARRERELIRSAIKTAMLEASGERQQVAFADVVEPARTPAPLSNERRLEIAQTLLGSVTSSNGSVAKLERSIARIEKSVQRQIEMDLEVERQLAIEREIEEEDEMILLMAA